jgi:hypothetical protein
LDPVARGLGPRRYDGDFLTDQTVHERGFTSVWPADNSNKTEFEFLCQAMRSDRQPLFVREGPKG